MISIIVPVYNVERYLHQCIDSILGQIYRNLEILLIDDGSPDKCGEICEEYARKDTRIRVFHTKRHGLSAARNLGLREAKGDYIGFVDSDDWIEPDMYQVLLQRLEETRSDVSACEIWQEHLENKRAGKTIPTAVYSGIETIRALVFSLINNTVWNKLYKKECWENIWFPDGHTFEDVATLYKVFLKTDSVSCTSKPLYHHRERDNSITHSNSMDNLIDCWNAFYTRYQFLSTLPVIKKDQEIMDKMETWLVSLAARTWIQSYSIPKEQRDYEFLRSVSGFVRDHFPFFGKKKWSFSLRTKVFLTRYANDTLFAVLFYLCECIRSLKKNRKQKCFS